MDVNYAARRKKKWKKALTLLGFIGPFFFMLFLFKILPIIANVGYSFQNVSVSTPGKFIWLKNWTRLMKDELFWTALKNTFTYLLYVGPVNIVFGFLFALLLNQKLRGRILVRGLVFFPYVLMTTVVGVIWRWMLNGSSMGILNHYLSFFGIDTIYWLTQKETAMLGVAIASIWWTIGYNTIIYLAALQDIPRDVIEAACLDGANGFQRVVRVYIPLVKGSTLTDITSCLKTESEETEMTAIEKVMMNVEGKFWTRQNEMVEELEELDYEVTAINYEYAAVVDTQDEDEREYILYLGHANTTMWVESAKEVA